jgi:hypothetical protein
MSRKRKTVTADVTADAFTEIAKLISIVPHGADNVEGVVTLPFDIDDDDVSELVKVRAGIRVNPTYEPLSARPETPVLPKSKPRTGKRPYPAEDAELHERVLREEAKKYCLSPAQLARREEHERILEQWRQSQMQKKESWEEPKSRQPRGPGFPHNLPFPLDQLAEMARANPMIEEVSVKKEYKNRLPKMEATTVERLIDIDGVETKVLVKVLPSSPRHRRKGGRDVSFSREQIKRSHLLSQKERALFLDYVAGNLAFNVVAERKTELHEIGVRLSQYKAKLTGETRYTESDTWDPDDSAEIVLIKKTGGSAIGSTIHKTRGRSFDTGKIRETERWKEDSREDNSGPDWDGDE